MTERPDKTTRADQNALAIMVAIIYAARMVANLGYDRESSIQKAISDAIAICEAVADDFPVSSD